MSVLFSGAVPEDAPVLLLSLEGSPIARSERVPGIQVRVVASTDAPALAGTSCLAQWPLP